MIRLWWLIWYFKGSSRPQESSAPSWYQDRIKRGHFEWYLAHDKRFMRDWRDSLLSVYYRLGGKQPTGTTEAGLSRAHKQFEMIRDLIDEAIEMEYLKVVGTADYPSDVLLTIDWKGRQFTNPFIFIEAVARKYGYFASIFTSFLFGAGGTYLLFLFWDSIQLYLPA